MGFIKGIFTILKDTTWPSPQQRRKDFISVLQYTAFFAVIIFVFDKLLSLGLIRLIDIF